MAWATIAQVKTITGKTVTAELLAVATASVEIHTGAIEGVTRVDMAARDVYWLRLMVCYQAAWLPPDYFERENVANMGQDGQSVTYAADGLTLAPLARLASKRLTWRGTRTLSPSLGRRPIIAPLVSDEHPWSPV